jgi:hypothetical protein
LRMCGDGSRKRQGQNGCDEVLVDSSVAEVHGYSSCD